MLQPASPNISHIYGKFCSPKLACLILNTIFAWLQERKWLISCFLPNKVQMLTNANWSFDYWRKDNIWEAWMLLFIKMQKEVHLQE